MLGTIVGFILVLLPIILALWVIETYFPTVPKLIRAIVIASFVILLVRLFHQWTCQLLCG